MIDLLIRVSLRQLRQSWGRTLLVVAGTATGVALISAVQTVSTTITENFAETLEQAAGPADLEVTLGLGEIGFAEDTLEQVKADPDVEAAVALVRGTVSLADDPTHTLMLLGADFVAEDDLDRYRIDMITDRREIRRWLGDPSMSLVTTRMAAAQHLDLGSPLKLATPVGLRTLVVRGIIETEGMAAALGGDLVLVDLPAAQMLLLKDRRIDQIDVILRKGADAEAVRRRLQAALPAGLTIGPPVQRILGYRGLLRSFRLLLAGLSSLCLIAGVFIIYNTTSTSAVHRAFALGRLRLMGAEPGTLFRLLMVEAAILGAAGSAIGVCAGVVLARLLAGMVSGSLGTIMQLRFPYAQVTVDVAQQIVAAGAGIAAATFASFFAARRAARGDPLDVMQGELAVAGQQTPTSHLVVSWLALLVVSAAAIVEGGRNGSALWGIFGATLWNASIIILAVPIVRWMLPRLAAAMHHGLGLPGLFAVESLARSTTRTGITSAAIALVLTVAVMLSTLSWSFRESMTDYLGRFLAANLNVGAISTEGGWLDTPLPSSLMAEVAKVPGVTRVNAYSVVMGQPYRNMRIVVAGMTDDLISPERFPPGWYREGDPVRAAEAIRAGRGATISYALSDRAGLHLGDTVELATPTGPFALPIVGVVPDFSSERGAVLVNRKLIEERWLMPSVQRLLLTTDPAVPLADVEQSIRATLGQRFRLKIMNQHDIVAYHRHKVEEAFAVTDAIQLLVLIVAVAGIFDLLVSAALERRRELAVWRLIGGTGDMLRRSLLIESAVVGSIGVVLGIAAGIVTAWLWVTINFRNLVGYYLDFHLATVPLLWYVALALLATTTTALVAGRQVTRATIVDDLHAE